tara:strand:+ start:575 stop:808 length:234 start_codon:yes stop_codon:yes gene_type:complete
MAQNLISIGILVIFIGFILILIGTLSSQKSDTKVAVGGFVGFIPFGFANDKNMLKIIMVIMVFLALLYFLLSYLLRI